MQEAAPWVTVPLKWTLTELGGQEVQLGSAGAPGGCKGGGAQQSSQEEGSWVSPGTQGGVRGTLYDSCLLATPPRWAPSLQGLL